MLSSDTEEYIKYRIIDSVPTSQKLPFSNSSKLRNNFEQLSLNNFSHTKGRNNSIFIPLDYVLLRRNSLGSVENCLDDDFDLRLWKHFLFLPNREHAFESPFFRGMWFEFETPQGKSFYTCRVSVHSKFRRSSSFMNIWELFILFKLLFAFFAFPAELSSQKLSIKTLKLEPY